MLVVFATDHQASMIQRRAFGHFFAPATASSRARRSDRSSKLPDRSLSISPSTARAAADTSPLLRPASSRTFPSVSSSMPISDTAYFACGPQKSCSWCPLVKSS